MLRVRIAIAYGAFPGGYTNPASCRVAVMLPVLCAMRVPGGNPAGICVLNACCSRMPSMSAVAVLSPTCRECSAMNSATRSLAVVTLFMPFRNAGVSSTPRNTTVFLAPRSRASAVIFAGSSNVISVFVARLLECVIMRSASQRRATSCPTRAYTVLSLSSAGSSMYVELSAIDRN